MTTYAVYNASHELVCRTHDPVKAEKVRSSVDGCIETIRRKPTAGELMAAEDRLAAA